MLLDVSQVCNLSVGQCRRGYHQLKKIRLIVRDLNAALNLQKLAGSSSERINACGEDVRPTLWNEEV